MRQEPAHVVHAWLGNSREVAEDHYLMVTDADYARASAEPSPTTSAANPFSKAVQKAVQSVTVLGRQGPSLQKEPAVSPAFANDTAVHVPPRGVEETRFAPRKPRRQKTATPNPTLKTNSSDVLDLPAISGSAAEPAGWVQKQIASLPPEVIAALWDMFRNQSSGLPPETGQS
jgi:hypothetical protein